MPAHFSLSSRAWVTPKIPPFSLLFILLYLILFLLSLLYLSSTSTSSSLSSLFVSPVKQQSPKSAINGARIAICLVGGARHFELTGPSIVKNLLEEYPNADLFLHSPLDRDSFKFSLLSSSPRISAGLLQYFNLVEGCLPLIKSRKLQSNFTYDFILRTRVDTFWSGPLDPDNFIQGAYAVPLGSRYGGLNDRLGLEDPNTSMAALSRLSLIPAFDSAGYRRLNSESALMAQLVISGVQFLEREMPFCVVSERVYAYPPYAFGVPVAYMGSIGPISGAKCRPCEVVCKGEWVEGIMEGLKREWSWVEGRNGRLELCNGSRVLEEGWERVFDKVAGEEGAAVRKRIGLLKMKDYVEHLKELKGRVVSWEAPSLEEICKLGLMGSSR